MNEDKIPAKLRLQHLQCIGCTRQEISYNMGKYYGLTDGQVQAMLNDRKNERQQKKLGEY